MGSCKYWPAPTLDEDQQELPLQQLYQRPKYHFYSIPISSLESNFTNSLRNAEKIHIKIINFLSFFLFLPLTPKEDCLNSSIPWSFSIASSKFPLKPSNSNYYNIFMNVPIDYQREINKRREKEKPFRA